MKRQIVRLVVKLLQIVVFFFCESIFIWFFQLNYYLM